MLVAQMHARVLRDVRAGGLTRWGVAVAAGLVAAVGGTAIAVGATPDSPPCTIYASPSGGGNGTTPDSTLTLYAANTQVIPGSVVCLEAGTYDSSSNIVLQRSGSPGSPITYVNYNGATVVIQYTGSGGSGGLLQTSGGTPWAGTHDLVIQGLTIDGANLIAGGIFVSQGSHHITIRNNTIRNTGATGIGLNASDYSTVVNNLVYRAGYNQGWSNGISLWYGGPTPTYGGPTAEYDSAPGFHNVVEGNIVAGDFDNSIHHSDGNGIIVDGSGSIPPALIANNLVYENGGRGIIDYANSGDVWVVNNTAYANGLDLSVGGGKAADFMANSASNVRFVNDLAYGRLGGSYSNAFSFADYASTAAYGRDLAFNGQTSGVASSVTSDFNRYRYADPQLTNAPAIPTAGTNALEPWNAANYFTPQAGSPAINAGFPPGYGMSAAEAQSAQPYLSVDLAGAARSQGPATDIGAYEAP